MKEAIEKALTASARAAAINVRDLSQPFQVHRTTLRTNGTFGTETPAKPKTANPKAGKNSSPWL